MQENRCLECGKLPEEGRLRKCPICFRWFCDDHAAVVSGRPFCSKGCASYFFFDDADD